MGCIQRMLLRLLGAPHGCGIGHTISLFQFNHTVRNTAHRYGVPTMLHTRDDVVPSGR